MFDDDIFDDSKHSHLDENQKNGKPYLFKADCLWCLHRYDIDKSDALKPKDYCSLQCQTEYEYTK